MQQIRATTSYLMQLKFYLFNKHIFIIFLHFISVKLFKINIHLIFNLHRIGGSSCFTTFAILSIGNFWLCNSLFCNSLCRFCNLWFWHFAIAINILTSSHHICQVTLKTWHSTTSCDILWHRCGCHIDKSRLWHWNWTTIFTCIYTQSILPENITKAKTGLN